jgi:hypothetical protein
MKRFAKASAALLASLSLSALARPSCPNASEGRQLKAEAYKDQVAFVSVFGELFDEHLKDAKKRIGGNGSSSCWNSRDTFLLSLLRGAPASLQKSTSYQVYAGRFHLLNGREDLARGHFVVAARGDYSNVYARYHLAKMARKAGDIMDERRHLAAGLESTSSDPVTRLYLLEMAERYPSVVSSWDGLKSLESGPWSKLAPNDFKRWHRMAEVALNVKNLEYLSKAIGGMASTAPDQKAAAEVSYFRGHLSLLQKQESQAASDFHAFIQSREREHAHDADVMNLLFPLLMKQGDLTAARKMAEDALIAKLTPTERFRRLQEEAILKGGLDRRKPIADLQVALQASPESTTLHLLAIEILGGLRRDLAPEAPFAGSEVGRRQAMYHLDSLESLKAAPLDRFYWRARIAQARGQRQDARAYIKAALERLKARETPVGRVSVSEIEALGTQLRNELP